VLLERSRWKNRATFATLIETRIDKLRKGRQLEIPDERVPGLIDKIAAHLADAMEPGAEFLLQAHQPPREPKRARAVQVRSTEKQHEEIRLVVARRPGTLRRRARPRVHLQLEMGKIAIDKIVRPEGDATRVQGSDNSYPARRG
jgi:hypothetical protein